MVMTQFYCKYTNGDRARLEVLLQGRTEWCVQKFLGDEYHFMIIEVSDVKKLGPKDWRRDMYDVPFHHLAVLFCNENIPSSRFLRKFCCGCGRSYLD